ncbi:MAG: hypothetical protein AAGH57_04520 [Pseudomonadota bacterium]
MMIANKLFKVAQAASLTAAAFLATGSPALLAEVSEAEIAPDASAFSPIQRYAIAFDQPRDLAEFYLRDFGLKTYGTKIQELDHPTDPNMRVLLITLDPVEGDAVTAVQWRFDISSDKGMWRTETAGIRRKCPNGPNAGEWTRDVCR